MSSIVIVAGRSASSVTLNPGQNFAATAYVVVDNSGATLPAGTLNGSETPPWTATLTGASGAAGSVATVTFTDLDTTGATIGTPVTITSSGEVITPPPATFNPVSATGSSITVTG